MLGGLGSDEGEPLMTPDVTYTYDRLGRIKDVDEKSSEGGMGLRSFAYDAAKPWRLLNETLPAAFGSRVLTRLYEAATSASAGTLGAHTKGTQKGRMGGFDLGIAGNPDRDLHQVWAFSNQARFAGLAVGVSEGTAVDFVYAYKANSALLEGYAQGSFTVARDYDTNRDLVTRLESKYSANSLARVNYTYDAVGRRDTLKQTGAAYAENAQLDLTQ